MPPIQDRPVDWEKLVTENENRLYRAALAVLGDSGEAEDMVQETFLKYLEKAPALESKEHEQAWLMKVLVNGCRDRLRSPWRKRHAPLLDTLPAHMEEEREELIELMALPEKERAVIALR